MTKREISKFCEYFFADAKPSLFSATAELIHEGANDLLLSESIQSA